jgi:hypothetical protein
MILGSGLDAPIASHDSDRSVGAHLQRPSRDVTETWLVAGLLASGLRPHQPSLSGIWVMCRKQKILLALVGEMSHECIAGCAESQDFVHRNVP